MNVGGLSDQAAGGVLLVASLLTLTLCLVLIVKVLRSLLQGKQGPNSSSFLLKAKY